MPTSEEYGWRVLYRRSLKINTLGKTPQCVISLKWDDYRVGVFPLSEASSHMLDLILPSESPPTRLQASFLLMATDSFAEHFYRPHLASCSRRRGSAITEEASALGLVRKDGTRGSRNRAQAGKVLHICFEQ
jgi:hypothetical protein